MPLAEVTNRGQDAEHSRGTRTEEGTLERELTPDDLETLRQLHDAGLIDLDALQASEPDTPAAQEWTYEHVRAHMRGVQDLAQSTTTERLRYLRFLEEHDAAPVDLRPPDRDSWLAHVQHRRVHEDVTGAALNHYRKALRSLLNALDVPIWPSLGQEYDETYNAWTLPPDDVVSRFWTDVDHIREQTRMDYLATTYAYVYHLGFHTGIRPPSEIVALDLDDVDFSGRRLRVTEQKKDRTRLLEDVPPFVLTAPNAKSVKNYIDHHRPKVDTGDSDALFLNSQGERFHARSLRKQLSRIGKTIWPDFRPYTMRRWFATQLLIATDLNVYVVAEKLGDKVATVEDHYLDRARARARMGDDHHLPRFDRRGGDT